MAADQSEVSDEDYVLGLVDVVVNYYRDTIGNRPNFLSQDIKRAVLADAVLFIAGFQRVFDSSSPEVQVDPPLSYVLKLHIAALARVDLIVKPTDPEKK